MKFQAVNRSNELRAKISLLIVHSFRCNMEDKKCLRRKFYIIALISSETLPGVSIMSVLNCLPYVPSCLMPYKPPCLAIPRTYSNLLNYNSNNNNNNNNSNNNVNTNNSRKNKNLLC